MKHVSDLFLFDKNIKEEDVGEGVTRKILGYDDTIMMVKAVFEEGSIGYVHAHPHSQVTFVESGTFDFMIGPETQRLVAGDSTYIPPGIDHGAVCVEAGMLLDIFSPVREDFLKERKA